MDKTISYIVSLGVSGLILLVTINAVGWTGAAAITAALASLGGPLGMLGGFATLGILTTIAHALTEHGFEALFKGVVTELYRQGMTKDEILQKVSSYPISRSLKRTLREVIEEQA